MALNLPAPTSALEDKSGSRERLLVALASLKPLSQEDADLINNAVREAREPGIVNLQTANQRERVTALRAKTRNSFCGLPFLRFFSVVYYAHNEERGQRQ